MVDGKHIPAVLVNVLQGTQLLLRVTQVPYLRLVVHVLERIDPERFAILAADNAASLLRSIRVCQSNQLFELIVSQLHGISV